MAAWDSNDPVERNRVGLLLGCFEKTHMLLMDLIALSVKLATRLGAIEEANVPALEVLQDKQVISQAAQTAIENQRQVRNTSQHVYVELSMSALRSAVLQQIETTPSAIRSVAAWVESLELAPEADI
jgi:uncharacterized protein YutE (UPF0331/DUF86 family)